MEFLEQVLTLPEPTIGGIVFMIWFFGAVGGYCFGRAHANWITLRSFIKEHR